MTHLVIGAGEVGTAVHAVLASAVPAQIRDTAPHSGHADVLHICIPYSSGFADTVHEYAETHGASLVVVHSTVPVGTCDSQGWVHSPVRGRHPHLEAGVRTFTKHFGGGRASEASEAFRAAGVGVRTHPSAAETEAGKLWELVQYGVQIRVQKAIYEWCAARGIPADVVYAEFADTYNSGYAELGYPHFVRPVLDNIPGPIGGHCVVPMSRLLDHPLSAIVQEGV